MKRDETLYRLARAAREQGQAPFDFAAAVQRARIDSDRLTIALALAWAQELPKDYRTLHDFVRDGCATGLEVAEVFDRAAEVESNNSHDL